MEVGCRSHREAGPRPRMPETDAPLYGRPLPLLDQHEADHHQRRDDLGSANYQVPYQSSFLIRENLDVAREAGCSESINPAGAAVGGKVRRAFNEGPPAIRGRRRLSGCANRAPKAFDRA